jgi:tetraacyldisaccharide 4'-kinase
MLLLPLAWLYRLASALRRRAYATGLFEAQRAPVPVIVVGNLVAGGAGKTPTVIALVEMLRRRGWTPGVVSRGYGSAADAPQEVGADPSAAACGDEPVLIRRRTGAPVWVGRRRADVARALCAANPEVDVVVSDDGLQHLALHRDAQLVVFDERGTGNGRQLPAGPLREPLRTAPPARTVVLYNAPEPTTPWPGARAQRALAGSVALAGWWRGEPPSTAALEALRGAPLLAAAGIAAPERFFSMLEAAGLTLRRWPLPDHAALDPRPWPADAGRVIVTEKDAVKIRPDAPDTASIHVAALDFRLPDHLVDEMLAWLPPRRKS